MGIAALIQLIQVALPLGIQIYTTFKRNPDGTTDIVVTLKQADAAFDADLKQVAEWRAAHPAA